jgi:signal transduction histidine kinase
LEETDGRPLALITVEDDGVGIPEEFLPNLFDAFVTSRLDSRGTGLGLTVASGIIQQHGGTISASNREEGGARLQLTLPAALAETGTETPRSAATRPDIARSEPRA